MSDSIDRICADYEKDTSRDRDLQLFTRLASGRGLAAELIQRLLGDVTGPSSLLAPALWALDREEFGPLAYMAIGALRRDPCHDAAADFVARASMQALTALHPHLHELFYLQPNWTTYCAMWPWRETGTSEFEFLKRHAGLCTTFWEGGPSRTTQRAALEALFETREVGILEFLEGRFTPEDFQYRAHSIGMARNAEGFRHLDSDQRFHLEFPSGYFDTDSFPACWLPMSSIEAEVHLAPQLHRFGGAGSGECRGCHQQLASLLTLTSVPSGLGITGLEQLSLQVCLSCLDFGVLFYEHDGQGTPSELATPTRGEPARIENYRPLRQTPVSLLTTPDRWKWQDWGHANSRENLNRLGGPPAWVQGADYPACPRCGQSMIHLLQLDSDLPTEDGGEWLWGSGGCAYVSWCDGCKVSAVQCQYT